MRWWPIALVLAIVGACGEEPAPRAHAPAPIASDEHRFTAELPAGWELATRSLTPHLVQPVEILSAGTMHGLRNLEGTPGNQPLSALELMGSRDAFVTVQESHGNALSRDRPAHFTLPAEPPRTEPSLWAARNASWLDVHWFDFRDARRGFHVLLAVGREAPPERRQEALALLDSLRFEPGPEGVRLDPDRAVPFRDRGLSWLMPLPGWRHYDWPLTSVEGERLALGTFELERTPPDRDCTPRAAIDALPDDGAFIYVFEYPDQRVAPERAGELSLGPELSFECMGPSRMVRWRERGRDLQAHVYLGPRAGEQLRDEARSILNSIQVE